MNGITKTCRELSNLLKERHVAGEPHGDGKESFHLEILSLNPSQRKIERVAVIKCIIKHPYGILP